MATGCFLKQKEHFVARNARRGCLKKKLKGIHDRFQKDLVFRDSQLKVDRIEEKCIEMDELAQEDFTYRHQLRSLRDIRKTDISRLNTSGRNAPMKLRSDFREALTNMHHLHRKS